MKKLLLILALVTLSFAAEYKAIFNLTNEKQSVLEGAVLNNIPSFIKHYKEQGDSFKAVVIISGGAYRYFIDDIKNSPYKDDKTLSAIQKELKPQIEALVKSGVKFEMCSMGMQKHHIKKTDIYPFVKPVFNRGSSLIEWQSKGYSLIDVH